MKAPNWGTWRSCPLRSDCTRWSERAFAVWPLGSWPCRQVPLRFQAQQDQPPSELTLSKKYSGPVRTQPYALDGRPQGWRPRDLQGVGLIPIHCFSSYMDYLRFSAMSSSSSGNPSAYLPPVLRKLWQLPKHCRNNFLRVTTGQMVTDPDFLD